MEPDGFQAPNFGWTGFESTLELMARLRGELATAAGQRPQFSWYLRMDPQVEAVYGRADQVAVTFGDALRQLRQEGMCSGRTSAPPPAGPPAPVRSLAAVGGLIPRPRPDAGT